MTSPLKIGDELIEKAAKTMTFYPADNSVDEYAERRRVSCRRVATGIITAILPDLRASILETAAKECEEAPARHAEWYSEFSSRPLEHDMADWCASRIRSLKGVADE